MTRVLHEFFRCLWPLSQSPQVALYLGLPNWEQKQRLPTGPCHGSQRFQRDQGVELLTPKVGLGTRATVGPGLWQGQEPCLASSLSSLSSLARSPDARADPHLTGEIQVQIKTKS